MHPLLFEFQSNSKARGNNGRLSQFVAPHRASIVCLFLRAIPKQFRLTLHYATKSIVLIDFIDIISIASPVPFAPTDWKLATRTLSVGYLKRPRSEMSQKCAWSCSPRAGAFPSRGTIPTIGVRISRMPAPVQGELPARSWPPAWYTVSGRIPHQATPPYWTFHLRRYGSTNAEQPRHPSEPRILVAEIQLALARGGQRSPESAARARKISRYLGQQS